MSKIIGIDLGTTFSVVCFIDEHGQPDVVLNSETEPLTASALWIDDDDNMVVGQLALDNVIAFPHDVITMAKRSMGLDVRLRAHGKEFTPPEVSAVILRKLKQDAERHFGNEVTEAVITCPAYFGAAETQATEQAGQMAGFNVRRIFPEPAAAALAFGYDNPGLEQTLLVYDLGGGTFDITLFKVGPGAAGEVAPRIDMISTDGNRQLGGADWNGRVVDWVSATFVAQQGKSILLNALKGSCGSEEEVQTALDSFGDLPPTQEAVAGRLVELGFDREKVTAGLQNVVFDPRMDPSAHQDLYLRVERAKLSLSRVGKAVIVCQLAGLSVKVELTREKFKELTQDLLDSTEQAIDRLLIAKGYSHDQIDQVLCVGGSTRLEMVRDMLRRKFPNRVNTNIKADLCVAQGAARMASLLRGPGPSPVPDPGPSLISPHAYGVGAKDEHDRYRVYPVILKDQKLPCASARPDERSRPDYEYGQFFTSSNNMTQVVLSVYEFDVLSHADIQDPELCRKIGSVVIDELPPNRPRGQEIFATFEMDESLQLTVSALDVSSGTAKSVQLTLGDATSVSKKQAEGRVKAMSKLLEGTEIQS